MAENRYKKISKNKFLLIFIFIIIFLVYCYLPLVVKIKKLNALIVKIERDIVNLKEENRLLEEEKEKLKSNWDYIGRLAREKLDLILPGEIIYKIVEE